LRHAGERTIATFSLPIILWIHSDYENALGPWAARATNSSEREIYNAGAPFKPAPASLKGHPSTESPLPRDTRTPQGVICVSRDVRER